MDRPDSEREAGAEHPTPAPGVGIAPASITLRDVEFVDALARHANFTRAAAELGVAQPALSSTIRRLEADVRVRLFDRTSRAVVPTDAGRAFAVRARRVLADVGRLSAVMGEFAGGLRGVLRLSWWYHTDPTLLPFLHAFTAANPGVAVSVEELSTTDSLARLRNGDIDIASVTLRRGIDLRRIEHCIVRTESFSLVTPTDHRLAPARSVRVDDLRSERFIAPSRGTALRTCLDDVFANREQPQVAIETNELASMIAFISEGLGVAILPPSIAQRAAAPVAIVPLDKAALFVQAVSWLRDVHVPIVQRAIDLLSADQVGALDPPWTSAGEPRVQS